MFVGVKVVAGSALKLGISQSETYTAIVGRKDGHIDLLDVNPISKQEGYQTVNIYNNFKLDPIQFSGTRSIDVSNGYNRNSFIYYTKKMLVKKKGSKKTSCHIPGHHFGAHVLRWGTYLRYIDELLFQSHGRLSKFSFRYA